MKTTEQFDNGLANPRSPTKAPRAVEVHIEELVLHGFAPGDRHSIAGAVKQELARSIAQEGLSGLQANFLSLEWIDGGAFNIKVGCKAQAAGTQIAQSVYRSLRQQTRASSASAPSRPRLTGGNQ